MPYDEALAERVRDLLTERSDLREKKMFGGLCFLLGGNMACGITSETLMVRVGKDAYESSLAEPEAAEMTFTGRAMRGMVYVEPESLIDDAILAKWVGRGVAYAGSLPPK